MCTIQDAWQYKAERVYASKLFTSKKQGKQKYILSKLNADYQAYCKIRNSSWSLRLLKNYEVKVTQNVMPNQTTS